MKISDYKQGTTIDYFFSKEELDQIINSGTEEESLPLTIDHYIKFQDDYSPGIYDKNFKKAIDAELKSLRKEFINETVPFKLKLRKEDLKNEVNSLASKFHHYSCNDKNCFDDFNLDELIYLLKNNTNQELYYLKDKSIKEILVINFQAIIDTNKKSSGIWQYSVQEIEKLSKEDAELYKLGKQQEVINEAYLYKFLRRYFSSTLECLRSYFIKRNIQYYSTEAQNIINDIKGHLQSDGSRNEFTSLGKKRPDYIFLSLIGYFYYRGITNKDDNLDSLKNKIKDFTSLSIDTSKSYIKKKDNYPSVLRKRNLLNRLESLIKSSLSLENLGENNQKIDSISEESVEFIYHSIFKDWGKIDIDSFKILFNIQKSSLSKEEEIKLIFCKLPNPDLSGK
jgi:hypothetical protein